MAMSRIVLLLALSWCCASQLTAIKSGFPGACQDDDTAANKCEGGLLIMLEGGTFQTQDVTNSHLVVFYKDSRPPVPDVATFNQEEYLKNPPAGVPFCPILPVAAAAENLKCTLEVPVGSEGVYSVVVYIKNGASWTTVEGGAVTLEAKVPTQPSLSGVIGCNAFDHPGVCVSDTLITLSGDYFDPFVPGVTKIELARVGKGAGRAWCEGAEIPGFLAIQCTLKCDPGTWGEWEVQLQYHGVPIKGDAPRVVVMEKLTGRAKGERDRINEIRADIKKDFAPIYWHSKLATMAQAWADTCPYNKIQSVYERVAKYEFGYINELVLSLKNRQGYSDDEEGGRAAINYWYKEHDNFDDKTIQCKSGKQCRNYKQLVWEATGFFGCGYSVCGNTKNHVCCFGEGGNSRGGVAYVITQQP